MDTGTLGALAEIRFVERCLTKGIIPLKPVVEHNAGYDFVIETDEGFKKVQVKKTRIRKVGNYEGVAVGNPGKYIGKNSFDYMALVSFEFNTVWMLPAAQVNAKQSIAQSTSNIKEWDDYIF